MARSGVRLSTAHVLLSLTHESYRAALAQGIEADFHRDRIVQLNDAIIVATATAELPPGWWDSVFPEE